MPEEKGVTVVVPTFNDSEFLVKNLESVASQNYPTEIIIVDDCSTKPICQEAIEYLKSHPGIRLIRHTQNGGLSASRNTGIQRASNDLILPLDADDFLYPGVIRKMVAAFEDDVSVVYGNLTDSGKLFRPMDLPWKKHDFIRDNPLFASSMFRRQAWEKVGGYKVRPHAHYEDWCFWGRVWKTGHRFKYIDITVYHHLNRGESMLKKLHDRRDEFRRMAVEHFSEDPQ